MDWTILDAMQHLYAKELNCSVSCFWDGGWQVKLGDEMNGWKAVRTFGNDDLDDAGVWLLRQAHEHYPAAFQDEPTP